MLICKKQYNKQVFKVKDHRLITGKSRSSAHNKCNRNLSIKKSPCCVL